MAYNMSYTTLPTFTKNSIGFNITLDSSNVTYDTDTTYTPMIVSNVEPGVYAFGSTFSGILAAGGKLKAELYTSTTTICTGEQSSDLSGSPYECCITLSHVFTLSTIDNLILILRPSSTISSQQYDISYGLVRIA